MLKWGGKKENGAEQSNPSSKLPGLTPLYWKPTITVTKSYTSCKMAEKIVFLCSDTQKSNYGTLRKAYCVSYRGNKAMSRLFVSIRRVTCQDFATYACAKTFATGCYLIRAEKARRSCAPASYIIYAQHLASIGLIISSNEMLISALILHAWAARRVWNRTLRQN